MRQTKTEVTIRWPFWNLCGCKSRTKMSHWKSLGMYLWRSAPSTSPGKRKENNTKYKPKQKNAWWNTLLPACLKLEGAEQLTQNLVKQGETPVFFCSSCRARSRLWRSSKRLWSVNYSQVVREQVKMQKTGCPQQWKQTKQTPKPNKQQNHHPEKKKASSELSETINYAFRTNRTLGALSSSSRRQRKIPQVDRCPTLPIVMRDFPAYIPAVEKVRYIGSPTSW